MNWNYEDAYKEYPIETGIAVFTDGSCLKTHDIFQPLPQFMMKADLIFCDPPWNQTNISSFYTKAEKKFDFDFEKFYARLFECIKQIKPDVCYIEIGKEYLDKFLIELKKIFKYVTFYNSTYYHKKENKCYIIRGSHKYKKPKLDYIDEEDIISWACQNEEYTCIADLCMGRGLVAVNAFKCKKAFVGTELNHKRLSVTIKRLSELGAKYQIFYPNKLKEFREKKGFTQQELAKCAGISLRQYQRYEDSNIQNMKLSCVLAITRKLNISVEDLL